MWVRACVLYPVLGTHLRICVARAVKRERAILTHVRGLGLASPRPSSVAKP